ncbi:glycosyltransferase [Shewanella dokdonensis]|uniref:glycosyltransferase n=1 Tax=Shewanella dokdonensis TaxID=712036 RepID=UPI0031401574
MLGLPKNKKLLLFGAMSSTTDPRKGYHLLIAALNNLKKTSYIESIELVIFGASSGKIEETTGFKAHYMGRMYDDASLCLLYNAADIFLAPSIQDNLPNTLVESLACGTPCLAFNIGGMKDLIDDESLGHLVEFSKDGINFSDYIIKIIENKNEQFHIAEKSFSKRSYSNVASQYEEVYNSLLGGDYGRKL